MPTHTRKVHRAQMRRGEILKEFLKCLPRAHLQVMQIFHVWQKSERNLTKFVLLQEQQQQALASWGQRCVLHLPMVQLSLDGPIWISTIGKNALKNMPCFFCFCFICPGPLFRLATTDGQLVSHINHRTHLCTRVRVGSSSGIQAVSQLVSQSASQSKQIWQFTVVVVVVVVIIIVSNFNPPWPSIWGLLSVPLLLVTVYRVPSTRTRTGYSLCIDTVVVVAATWVMRMTTRAWLAR